MDETTVAFKLGTLSADVAGLKSDVADIKADQKWAQQTSSASATQLLYTYMTVIQLN